MSVINFNKYVGEKIFLYRKQNKLSLIQLAEKLYITRTQLNNIELGISGTSLFNYYIICTTLNISISDILPAKDTDLTTLPSSKKEYKKQILQNKIDQLLKERDNL